MNPVVLPKNLWNQSLWFAFPTPHTFCSHIFSVPLPVCPLCRNKTQGMFSVLFLIRMLVQGHVSAKCVSISLGLTDFR